MSAEKKKQLGVLGLVVALVVVLVGGLVFVGAVSGWFDDAKVEISAEYRGDISSVEDLSVEKYQKMIDAKKSFLLFVDQNDCVAAERLRGFFDKFLEENKLAGFRMMFGEMKESSLHDYVKYYPSVVVIGDGQVKGYLKADSDEDADMYNEYDSFERWLNRYLR